MLINSTRKIESLTVPVILIRSDKKAGGHPFYKSMSEEDRTLILRFLEKTSFDKPAIHTVFLPSGNRIILLGAGEKAKFNNHGSILAMRKLIAAAKKEKIRDLEVSLLDFAAKGMPNTSEIAEVLATQLVLANYDHVTYRTPEKEGWDFVDSVHVWSEKNVQKYLDRGRIIGEEINEARELSNIPGGDMTPEKLADAAKATGKKHSIKVMVLGPEEMKKLGMGGVLGVAQGSGVPPRFIVMEYLNGPKKEKPVVLTGKGITFDSGGLNIKPDEAINEMHMDMSGGAAVIHVLGALARLRARKNVIGIVPAAENMPSGMSYRPGDVLRTMAGKTIEVNNTDAEGRVVLADALEYSQKYDPRLVIDIATLTGAAMKALGQRASAIFATDEKLSAAIQAVGEKVLDRVWPLPLWEEFEEDIKGTFGDWSNTGKDKYGGAITAAVFLWQFIKPYPFVHLDIAPRMTSIEGDHLAKGAAGAPVNLLVHFLENY